MHGRPTQAGGRISKWNEGDKTECVGKCFQREDSNESKQRVVAHGQRFILLDIDEYVTVYIAHDDLH